MERFVSGDSIVFADDRYFPVIVTTFYGALDVGNSKAFVAWQERQSDRARREGTRLVSVSDSAHADRPPPEVRRFLAEWMGQTAERGDDPMLKAIAVITNPLVRGALTAIGWLRPEIADVAMVPNMGEALALAIDRLAEAGIAPPPELDPDGYVGPTPADTHSRTG